LDYLCYFNRLSDALKSNCLRFWISINLESIFLFLLGYVISIENVEFLINNW